MKSSEVAFRRIGSDAELLSPENSDRPAAPCWTHHITITRLAYPVELARVQAKQPILRRMGMAGENERHAYLEWHGGGGEHGRRRHGHGTRQQRIKTRMTMLLANKRARIYEVSWRIGGCARLWCPGPRTEIVRSGFGEGSDFG
jgi:hypothetical protein